MEIVNFSFEPLTFGFITGFVLACLKLVFSL